MSRARFVLAVIRNTALSALFAIGSGLLFAGCKSTEVFDPRPEPSKPIEHAARTPSQYAEPPADSKLSTVKRDMTHEQVQEIMGSPTGQLSYPTAGTYNPYGSDSGNRVVYKYESEGRVLFAVPKY